MFPVSVFDLNAERERQLRVPRSQFSNSSPASVVRSPVRELLGLTDKGPGAWPIQIVSEIPNRGYRLRKFVIESEPGIAIPAVELVPEAPDSQTPIVVKVGADRALELAPGGPAERLALSGRRVVVADLRGMGATSPPSPPNRGESLMGTDTKEAFLSLHIGRPLLGQRVFDLICLLESLQSREGSPAATGLDVTGIGPAGLAVLHAAALDEKGLMKHVILERTLISWTDVVERGVNRAQLAGVVPGVLAYFDLPDLAARLHPCPLTIRHPTDALGLPVAQAELEAVYPACLQAYGNRGKLALQAGP